MKKSIIKSFLFVGVFSIGLLISGFAWQQVIVKNEIKQEVVKKADGFVVLELFTSQGCSSCPPADAVIAKYVLENDPNIIPMAFHVDYWNYIGWKDPFSKAQFSERQRDYASMMNSQGNYTPQLVINGKHELVGSKENAINEIVNKELALKKQYTISIEKVTLSDNQVIVDYNVVNSAPNTIINLALVKKEAFTSIKRGENSGLKQTNYNIVFDFKTVSSSNNKSSFEFSKEWSASDFLVVAYLQNSKTGTILAATKSEIK